MIFTRRNHAKSNKTICMRPVRYRNRWKNPLVSDMETANHLADWLGDYYNAGIEYEYNTRGNPEIDANDIVYQENAYRPGLKVNIYRHVVNFSQSLSGKVIARRVSEK